MSGTWRQLLEFCEKDIRESTAFRGRDCSDRIPAKEVVAALKEAYADGIEEGRRQVTEEEGN